MKIAKKFGLMRQGGILKMRYADLNLLNGDNNHIIIYLLTSTHSKIVTI